jgi:hypothetical protein
MCPRFQFCVLHLLKKSDSLYPAVLPDLCKPSRLALPLTLLVHGGDRGAQAQLNLRPSQPKSLSQYLYISKKMVLITDGHFCGNFPQPDIFLYCRFWVIRPWPRPSVNHAYSVPGELSVSPGSAWGWGCGRCPPSRPAPTHGRSSPDHSQLLFPQQIYSGLNHFKLIIITKSFW